MPLSTEPIHDEMSAHFTGSTPLVFLPTIGSRTTRRARYRGIVDEAASGSYVAIVLRIASNGRMRRLARQATVRTRVAAAERAILHAGRTALHGRYGAYPSPESPALIFELGGAAEAYTRAHLIPGTPTGIAAVLRRVLWRWTGCDPVLGAVVVVGRKL